MQPKKLSHTRVYSSLLLFVYNLLICVDDEIQGRPFSIEIFVKKQSSFHSRDQQLCKFIGTKESVYIRKDFNSHRIGLVHQYGRQFIVFGTPMWPPFHCFWCTNMAAVPSIENALYSVCHERGTKKKSESPKRIDR